MEAFPKQIRLHLQYKKSNENDTLNTVQVGKNHIKKSNKTQSKMLRNFRNRENQENTEKKMGGTCFEKR